MYCRFFADYFGRLCTLQTYSKVLDDKEVLLHAKAKQKIDQLKAQIIAECPEAIVLQGRIGLHELAMGLYIKRQGDIINGAPLYAIEGRKSYFLGRSKDGYWCCSESAESIQSNGAIMVSEAPERLPIGVSFKFDDGQNMIRDPLITARIATPRTAVMELTAAFDKIGLSRV